MIKSINDLLQTKKEYLQKLSGYQYQALVCGGSGCVSANCGAVEHALRESLEKYGLDSRVKVIQCGCMGTCAVGPVVYVLPDNTYYTELSPEKMDEIVKRHFLNRKIAEKYSGASSMAVSVSPKEAAHATECPSPSFWSVPY